MYNLILLYDFQIPLQGLSALHASPVQVHGHLRSSKCLIDSRWVCKVADYGLHLLKSGQSSQDVGEHAKYKSKFSSVSLHASLKVAEDAICFYVLFAPRYLIFYQNYSGQPQNSLRRMLLCVVLNRVTCTATGSFLASCLIERSHILHSVWNPGVSFSTIVKFILNYQYHCILKYQ